MRPDAGMPVIVDLWRMETSAFSPDRWEHLLPDAERRQAARFLHARDRRDYVAAHALTRSLLASLGLGESADIDLISGPYGKPRLAETNGWRFNLTHTDGFVAVAAARNAEVGIDAEALDRARVDPDLTETVFTESERETLEGPDSPAWRHDFFRLWTLKEAVIKMLGTGLSTPLDSFQVLGDPPQVEFLDGRETPKDTYFLHTETTGPNHVLALCVESRGRPVEIRSRLLDATAFAAEITEGMMPA